MVVDSAKKKRRYTNEDKANLDIFCFNDSIGTIVNLSQEINTIMWDHINRYGNWKGAMKAYYDNCLLSILSTIAIDTTKREYPIDCMEEFRIIRAKYDRKDNKDRAIRPQFFAHVAKKKGYYNPKKKNYLSQMAPMDYLQKIVDGHKKWGAQGARLTHTVGDCIKDVELGEKPRRGYVDLVLSMIKEMDSNIRMLYQIKGEVTADSNQKAELSNLYFKRCIDGIRNLKLNNATMRELLIEMDKPENSCIRRRIWTVVFGSLGDELYGLLKTSETPVYTLEECKQTDEYYIKLFDIPFRKVLVA